MTTTDLLACGLIAGAVGLLVPVQRRRAARLAHWRRELLARVRALEAK